ncbi:NAD(P)H-binding protein [Galbibacter sp.]|uniref:NmrA family NAD(P)-binding protein n=1 Tax=Galbibacter sp. TaxID=2918471 RepID=UPI002C34F07D|nr:NAD(P)H-binding protein [Galbibacter sp.]HLV63291.1 NAD(P)H-binding protein [Galbibacter sp.]
MNITLTGSLGHIGKPLTRALCHNGHQVTVISSNAQRAMDITSLGATPAIGTIEDVDFLTESFKGADAVYTMIPPNDYFNDALDLIAYYRRIGRHYKQAIKDAGVKKVVNLSSIGAHLSKGNGILLGAHDVEQTLNKLPLEVAITHIRPTAFYYNLLGYIEKIQTQGFISANYGADDIIPWVSPFDIAATIQEVLSSPFTSRAVQYVASEELTGHQTARILGEAIGIPDLEWKIISDQKTEEELIFIGMNPAIAKGLTQMYAGLHNGILTEDYWRHKPTLGKVKLRDFAKEFSCVFHAQSI